ncbi:stage II sporulation protein P [Cohnella lubricantis]|uniref:Stage II sporulation protein P n=1 Tax=Cohnella lubricantis TaxID=2163172 RepID=A0A841T9P9_9BACL|nr:stage II sporulation protein P [Cohnella lubricantis]MBB6675767.1 stage II sporulation protein P [Cohnella lubricantis]MBP2119842.1 stage II sporulation protein P [Cohnella lubricantis]
MLRFIAPHGRRRGSGLRRYLVTGQAFLTLSLCTMALLLALGAGGALQTKLSASPVQSMKGFAASVSSAFFSSLLGMELPHMDKQVVDSPFSAGRMAAFLVRFLTDMNPDDPKSLLELGMPGIGRDSAVLLRPGSGGGTNAPVDREPDGSNDGIPRNPVNTSGGSGGSDMSAPDASPSGQPESSASPSSPPQESPLPSTPERNVVFIYHSHNRESWFPELKEGTKLPESSQVNVTLVGRRLADQLERLGVGAVHSNTDYMTTVKNYNWNNSYKYSMQTVKEAIADNKDLTFFFDIHRDSLHRKQTTATINGADYAKVYFIIGQKNPDWEKNEAFANSIHQALEEDYPGLSNGIWSKTTAEGNGEYNQSVSPDSVLIEIGGVDNTLAECYRTADVLAQVIAELYWNQQDAEKVDAQAADEAKEANES